MPRLMLLLSTLYISIILYFQNLLWVLLSVVKSKFDSKFLTDNLIWINMATNIKEIYTAKKLQKSLSRLVCTYALSVNRSEF
jgi:hypothetical protein